MTMILHLPCTRFLLYRYEVAVVDGTVGLLWSHTKLGSMASVFYRGS